MRIFSKYALQEKSPLPKPWQPAFQSPELATKNGWSNMAYGDGNFVAITYSGGANFVSASANGKNWATPTQIVIQGASHNFDDVTCMAYGNGRFIAIGRDFFTSADGGKNWEVPQSGGITGRGIANAIFDGEKFVVIDSEEGVIWTSTNGLLFTQLARYGFVRYFTKIAYNGEIYIVGCSDGRVCTSPNLINWTWTTPLLPLDFIEEITLLGYDGSRFFAIDGRVGTLAYGKISYTTDGVYWTVPEVDTQLGEHQWYAHANNGFRTVLISRDSYISTKRV